LEEKDSIKHPFIIIRLTPTEAKNIKEIRQLYGISARAIFEIICNCGCQEGIITANVKQDRKRKGTSTKEVRIPRNIISKRKI